jgi:hypothetical protein
MFGGIVYYHLLCISKYFNMEEKDYLADINEIKNMMARSSQFISLSGLSGILAGTYALIGAYVARNILSNYRLSGGSDYDVQRNAAVVVENDVIKSLVAVAAGVLVLSLATGIIMSSYKAKRVGETVWNSTSKRLLVNFLIPLLTGGIFTLLLVRDEYYNLVAPATLIFYGMACINAGKYTFRDVRYLGVTMTLLGLIATAFPGNSLVIWAIGFGLCHIIYGAIMYFKYDRKVS